MDEDYPPDIKKHTIILEKNEENINYSWNNEGVKVINPQKKYLTHKDLITIRYCFKNPLPDNLREEYWLLVTGAKEAKLNNPNYYNTLLNKYPENPISIRGEKQILLDIYRTFPEDKDFNEKKINSLKNILTAYSRRNCTLGYCQGFNYIVGKILKVINNEENAFWIFTQIIENILPINYFYDSVGLIIDNNILFDVLKKVDKELMDHFSKFHFNLLIENILYKWLICLFSQNIKDELLFLIWDIFFLDGTFILFRTIIIIFEKNKEKLMEIQHIDKLVNLFDSVHNLSLLNQQKEELLNDLMKYDETISNKLILDGRKKYYKKVKESMKGFNKKRFNTFKINNCDGDWDNCSFINRKFDGDDFVVYQKKDKMEVIENYYQKKIERCNSLWVRSNKKTFEKMINNFHEYTDLLVQRRVHECPNSIKKRILERMNSCIEIKHNIAKDMLNGKYKMTTRKKLKDIKKNKKEETQDNSKNKDVDDPSFDSFIYYSSFYD